MALLMLDLMGHAWRLSLSVQVRFHLNCQDLCLATHKAAAEHRISRTSLHASQNMKECGECDMQSAMPMQAAIWRSSLWMLKWASCLSLEPR